MSPSFIHLPPLLPKLQLSTGGHCCSIAQISIWRPSRSVAVVSNNAPWRCWVSETHLLEIFGDFCNPNRHQRKTPLFDTEIYCTAAVLNSLKRPQEKRQRGRWVSRGTTGTADCHSHGAQPGHHKVRDYYFGTRRCGIDCWQMSEISAESPGRRL